MDKPRIFLGSSGKQEKLLQALTQGLEDVAHVEPWTTSFNPRSATRGVDRRAVKKLEIHHHPVVFA
jgi:hypothetical protein